MRIATAHHSQVTPFCTNLSAGHWRIEKQSPKTPKPGALVRREIRAQLMKSATPAAEEPAAEDSELTVGEE